MRWRLRYQLLVPLAMLMLGIVGITTWSALSSVSEARQQLEERVRQVARTLSEAPQFPLSAQVLEHMKRLSGADFILLRNHQPYRSTLHISVPTLADAKTVNDWQQVTLQHRVQLDDVSYLYDGVQLRPPRQSDELFILYPEAVWQSTAWKAIQPSLIVGGFLGLSSMLITLAIGRRLTRRTRELVRRTRQIADGDFSPMPLPNPDDEIRDLSRSINEMAEKLAELQEAVSRNERLRLLGQVSGGLAHQLRNGITGARLSLQLYTQDLQREPNRVPDGSALDVALRQLNLLEAHLKRFLDLGRPRQQSVEPCVIQELIHETITLLQPRCVHASIELRQQLPTEPITIHGDAGQLRELLLNILTNAIEAAGSEGQVKITVRELDANRLLIEICDSGPGPSAEIAERLFEPLVTGKPEGVGLGLAVAQQVAMDHGGSVKWNRKNDRTCFLIDLESSRGTL